MDFKKFGNFNWIETDLKNQTVWIWQRIHFCSFKSIFVCWKSNLHKINLSGPIE